MEKKVETDSVIISDTTTETSGKLQAQDVGCVFAHREDVWVKRDTKREDRFPCDQRCSGAVSSKRRDQEDCVWDMRSGAANLYKA